jgi:PAS domain S-box-containing protein
MMLGVEGRTFAGLEYLHAVELTDVAVVGVDARGSIRLFNAAAERMSGFARDEILERPFVDTLLASSSNAHRPLIGELLSGATGRCAELVCPMRTSTGESRELSWKLMRLPTGTPAEVILFAFGEDLTEERAQAKRALDDAKVATIAALGTSLAHAIRNPLNGALLHVVVLERSLERRGIDGECTEALDVIEKEVLRLSTMLTEFLEFAQPTQAVVAPVSARALASNVTRLVEARFERAGVSLDVEIDDVVLSTDSVKVARALEQLLENAVEASSQDGHVVLRASQRGGEVLFQVEDHGAGLADPALPIFQPFVSTKASGTGLGLAIVQRIVADVGGSITFHSRPGSTLFSVTLPATSPLRSG